MFAEDLLEIPGASADNVLPSVLREGWLTGLVKQALEDILPALPLVVPTRELLVVKDEELPVLFSVVSIKVWLHPGDEIGGIVIIGFL